MLCESAALDMPANLENAAVATGLEKVSFHPNPKERQCQRMLIKGHHLMPFLHAFVPEPGSSVIFFVIIIAETGSVEGV